MHRLNQPSDWVRWQDPIRATSKPRAPSVSRGRVRGVKSVPPPGCPPPVTAKPVRRAQSVPPPGCPPPDMPCKKVLVEYHEICPFADYDWTKPDAVADWGAAVRNRDERNVQMKEALTAGRTIQCLSSGWSMYPWVHCRDCCVFEPVLSHDNLKQHDVVFCQVQPSGRYIALSILEIRDKGDTRPYMLERATKRCFVIGNMKWHKVGSCYDEHVYGKLVEVLAPGEDGWELV